MLYQTAMTESASIRNLSFTAVLFAGILVDSTVLEFMAGQNSCPWLQPTEPLEGGEGSDSDMSFATSAASSDILTAQDSITSSLNLKFESGSSTPIPPFSTQDTRLHSLSFTEAVYLTQLVGDGKETASSFDAETQPQYCSLDMLSNKTLRSWQGIVDGAKDSTSIHASETCRYYGMDSTGSLSCGNKFEPSSALLLTYGKDNHCESPQAIKRGLSPSRAQALTLGPTETCMGDEDGSPCPSMIDSDDSSVEDIEVRKAFACPYFRRDPVRHIECLSRKLYRIQDVKQHLYRRHYMTRDKSPDASDNSRGVNTRTQSILKLRLDRRLSPERQWHKIWETLFNLKLPREGPYLGDSKEEIVGSMIAVCKQGSSRVVPGILRSLGLSKEKRKSVQQLMEQLLSGFQALSDERSNAMEMEETEETEKASICGGVDSIPQTPKDMEFEFDFNIPLDRSPSPEMLNSYPSKDRTQIQESSSVTPTELPDYTTLKTNKEDILVGYQSTKHVNENIQVKNSWPPNTAVCTPKTFESSEMACATSNIESAGKSLTCLTHVLEDMEESDPYEYVDAWECHYCGFEYIFRPRGGSSDRLCFNYPCLGRLPSYYDSVYKARVIRGG